MNINMRSCFELKKKS